MTKEEIVKLVEKFEKDKEAYLPVFFPLLVVWDVHR